MKKTILFLLLFISVTSFAQFKTTISKLPLNLNGVTLINPVQSGNTVTLNFQQDAFWETKISKSKMDAKANASDLKNKADASTVDGLKKTITQLNADILLLRTTVQQLQSAAKPVPSAIVPQKNYDSIIGVLTARIASIPPAKNYDSVINAKIASIPSPKNYDAAIASITSKIPVVKSYDADIAALNSKIASIPAPMTSKNYDSAIAILNSRFDRMPASKNYDSTISNWAAHTLLLESKTNSIKTQLDSLPEIYLKAGHGTKDNPL